MSLGIVVAGCGQTDDRPYVWAYLSPAIFQPNCATAGCHSRGAAVSGLDFSTPERGYRSLTGLHTWVATGSLPPSGATGCEKQAATWLCPSPRPLVVPYAPGESRLIAMLRAQDAPRMPPDRPLPAPDIRLIEAWILNGASEQAGVPAAFDAAVIEGGGAPGGGAGGGEPLGGQTGGGGSGGVGGASSRGVAGAVGGTGP